MPVEPHDGLITAGEIANPGEVDRSASGLQFQKYQQDLTTTGAALGVGRRSAPNPEAQFSHPLSDSQFRGGSNARASVDEGEAL